MPGSATQRIVPCSRTDDHELHPNAGDTTEEHGWCPGKPASAILEVPSDPEEVARLRAAYEEARAAGSGPGVPRAGLMRELTEEVRAAADDALRKAGRLQAEAYSVVVDGIECRVIRGDQSSGRLSGKQLPHPAWWEATVDRAWSQEMMVYDPDTRRSAGVMVTTTAWFPFDPADIVNEQAMLERAGGYCEAVAHAILRLRAEQVATRDAFTEAVQAAAATHGAVTPE